MASVLATFTMMCLLRTMYQCSFYQLSMKWLLIFTKSHCFNGPCTDGLGIHPLCPEGTLGSSLTMWCMVGKFWPWVQALLRNQKTVGTMGRHLTTWLFPRPIGVPWAAARQDKKIFVLIFFVLIVFGVIDLELVAVVVNAIKLMVLVLMVLILSELILMVSVLMTLALMSCVFLCLVVSLCYVWNTISKEIWKKRTFSLLILWASGIRPSSLLCVLVLTAHQKRSIFYLSLSSKSWMWSVFCSGMRHQREILTSSWQHLSSHLYPEYPTESHVESLASIFQRTEVSLSSKLHAQVWHESQP